LHLTATSVDLLAAHCGAMHELATHSASGDSKTIPAKTPPICFETPTGKTGQKINGQRDFAIGTAANLEEKRPKVYLWLRMNRA
jgi:hypothetical protein